MSQQTYSGPLRPTIRAHGEYPGNLEQRARAQRTLAGKYSLERAQVGAARVLELVPSRINWFESKYGEWLATGAEAVCDYSDGSLPQLGLPGPLRPNTQTHKEYLQFLKMRESALRILGGIPTSAAEEKAEKILSVVPERFERFESRYAEWLATGTEAVWGFSETPLPGLPEMA